MGTFILIAALLIFIFLIVKSLSPPEKLRENLYDKAVVKPIEEIEFTLSDYPESYIFDVSGVHLERFVHPVINYTKVNAFVTLEPEPTNKFDKDAILVKLSNWEIGYVPSSETYEVQEILNKKHIAYISKREIHGYFNVTVTIRYLN